MTKIIPLAAALLLALSAPASAADPQKPKATPTRALANLATYLSDADYPAEAIRNQEQGTVGFLLQVGSDGRPTGCSITSSSGSSSLDAATCRLMVSRPRFQPARDARGNAIPDQVSARITWRLPKREPRPRLDAAFTLWSMCVMGEAARHVPGALPPSEVTRRSFVPCAALEAIVAEESERTAPEKLRGAMAETIEKALLPMRDLLLAPPAPGAPVPSTPQQ
ncbi:MAG TPA: energy transducer TonB [Allosphingosinicella sp.]|jgi:TonB family protein